MPEFMTKEAREVEGAAVRASRDSERAAAGKRRGAAIGDLAGKSVSDMSPKDRYRWEKAHGLPIPHWSQIDNEQKAWDAAEKTKADEAERKAAEEALAAQRARLGG